MLTDALIGTFSRASDGDLRQNRCFLYHVIGNGTGDWDVPVGGMGAVTAALEGAARAAGAELLPGADVEALTVGTGGVDVDVRSTGEDASYAVRASHRARERGAGDARSAARPSPVMAIRRPRVRS